MNAADDCATDQLCCVPTVVCELLQSSTVYVPLIRVLLIDALAKFFLNYRWININFG